MRRRLPPHTRVHAQPGDVLILGFPPDELSPQLIEQLQDGARDLRRTHGVRVIAVPTTHVHVTRRRTRGRR